MKTLPFTINYDTYDTYRDAVNYDGTNYYNAPITITINNQTFILPCGSNDDKTVKQKGTSVYVVSENQSLDYIGLTLIDLETNNVSNVFMHGNDINDKESICYNIFKKSVNKQIAILSNWIY